ncbi:hypothetical protein [Cognatishimia maritima]|uniref:Uncharacterized protein n=1 Tax=Cognatishimia maritima TaxID=870908 RepID=A0A1M5VIT0_9RHOB|nr:hypothetical protein [Cognatishimia maritima]SHH75159.1 hypothetical protein SAMN04488044_3186 [Cognatishimia maritima]
MKFDFPLSDMPRPRLPEPLKAVMRKFSAPRDAAPLAFLPEMEADSETLIDRIKIPVNTSSLGLKGDNEVRENAQFLARQDRWDCLSERIRMADRTRDVTVKGTPIVDLMLFGARADVVSAAEHALLHGKPAKDSNFFDGIEDFELVLTEYPDDYAVALVVAHMHIDIGWAWRGTVPVADLKDANREAFLAHFARAEEILDQFCPHELNSAALSAARCALLPGSEHPGDRVADDFEDLIDLDPDNPRHMRALGTYMLPQWYGDHANLDLQARRTAARTYDLWGAGAYAWVWFDALLIDPTGLAHIDTDYFIDGIHDILDRHTDQATANLVAAQLYCAWQAARQHYRETGTGTEQQAALRAAFEDVVHNALREVHPLIWGHAELGFDNGVRSVSMDRLAQKGRDFAMNAVAQPFMKNLEAGLTIHFGPDGITEIQP